MGGFGSTNYRSLAIQISPEMYEVLAKEAEEGETTISHVIRKRLLRSMECASASRRVDL